MKNIYKALAAFQQDVPNIYKNSQGYGYKFADLGEINDIIKPLLKKHGLGYTQPIEGDAIKTVLFHVDSGETIESLTNIPQGVQLAKMNEFQVLGSAITYLRRYSLSSMLGLVTDEDADAAGEQVKRPPVDYSKSGADQEILARAKPKINSKMEEYGLNTAVEKQQFITLVLNKSTIDNTNDANLIMDALENEIENV